MSILPALGFLAAAAGFATLSMRVYRTFFSPAGLFGLVWMTTIGLYSLGIVEYVEVRLETWLMIGASIAAFLAGCLAVHVLRPPKPQEHHTVDLDLDPRALAKFIVVSGALGLVGFAIYLSIIQRHIGLDTFRTNPHLVRDLQATPEFRSEFAVPRFLNYLNIATVALGVYWLASFRAHYQTWRRVIKAATITAFATTLFAIDRTFPIAALSCGYFVYEATVDPRKTTITSGLFRITTFVAVLVVVFMAIASFSGKTVEQNRSAFARFTPGEEYASFAYPYMYVTGNIPAFQEFVRHTDGGVTHGKFVFLPLVKFLGIFDRNVVVPEEVGKFYLIPFEFNTTTWLNIFWSDFGFAGLVVLPMMVGALSTWLHLRLRASRSLANVFVNALGLYVILNSVFVNKIVSSPTWMFAIIAIVVPRFLRTSRPQAAAGVTA